jgi:dolichyl-phosphate-mannose-protein mannosyltransferase
MFLSISPARRRPLLAIGLASLLFLVYVLTLTGITRTNDELWIIDSTETVATGGDFQFNQTLYLNRTAGVEPIMPLLAAPLYWLVLNTPWIGNMHGMALFNPIITALTALLIFQYALMLGYGERTALVTALLFGLTSMAAVYAQTYFREPLTGLGLVGTAYTWERWRRAQLDHQPRRWVWFGTAVAVTALAVLSKESALIVLPAFILLAFPGMSVLRGHRKQVVGAMVTLVTAAALVAGGLLLLQQTGALFTRYQVGRQIELLIAGVPLAAEGLLGYFVSPGKAIWWYSPVTVLALISPIFAARTRWRETWLMLATVLWFGFVYAANKGALWFGGAGWGARFMLPIIPFLMIAALPALDRMISGAAVWPKIVLAVLGIGGLVIQIGGVYVNLYQYYTYYQQSTHELPWLGPAIWDVRWSQAVGSLLFLPQARTDILWLAAAPDWITIALIAGGIAGALMVVISLHRASQPSGGLVVLGAATPFIALAITLFGLSREFMDTRYLADNPSLWQLKGDLEQKGHGDTILLSTRQYVSFFLNFYKGGAIWYALPDSPGERFSPEQPPEVVSEHLEDLIAPDLKTIFEAVSEGGPRYHARPVWLVVDTGPFLSWATRPPEHYLAQNGYTISATEYSPRVRLVGYLPRYAPASLDAERPVDAQFGASIHLLGYDVWSSSGSPERIQPGDMMGVSLVWQTTQPVTTDYTVAIHWIDANGQVVAQQDRQPVGGFRPTSGWRAREKLRDNYGFVVPDLPPGRYTIRVTVYQWPSLERLAVTDSHANVLGDSFGLFTLEVR